MGKEQRLGNALEPYRERIAGLAVESTHKRYWLVDGLLELGYTLHLANENGDLFCMTNFKPGAQLSYVVLTPRHTTVNA